MKDLADLAQSFVGLLRTLVLVRIANRVDFKLLQGGNRRIDMPEECL
ncbi:MAG: hypothetical protein ACLFWD_05790 [Anaerolineales bacterium]